MTRILVSLTALALLMLRPSYLVAENYVEYPSQYYSKASQQDSSINSSYFGKPGQESGDIIAPVNERQVAEWCDFSKQILVYPDHYLCSYAGRKYTPPQPPGAPAPPTPSAPAAPGMNAS